MTNTDKLSEINATVVTKTKNTLEGIEKLTGLTVGEILDRMVLNCCPTDTDKAYLLILDNILISTENLNQEQFNETIYKVLKALEDCFAVDEPEKIKNTLKGIVDKLEAAKAKNILGGKQNG